MALYEQRNLSLTPDQWLALEALAVATNSRATRGTRAHQHSWRKLVERIADGEIIMVERNPYQMPPGLDEAVQQVEQRQREQELQAEHRQRVTAHTKVVRKTPPLKMTQLDMFPEPA